MVDIFKAKDEVTSLYKRNGIDEKSEAEWLFCHVLNVNKTKLLLINKISKKQYKKIMKFAKQRIAGKPLAKIIKNCNFYGLDFKVNKYVLTPRKETEILVEKVIKDFKGTNNKKILDLCTGSGAIAITLKSILKANVTGSDISKKALKVARNNAKQNNVNINFIESDLFENIDGKFNAIVSNPPYIKSSDINSLQVEVKHYDPLLALDGGANGLNFYKQIIKKAPQILPKNGKIYLELGKGQFAEVKNMLEINFKDINIIKDYNNVERVIYATKR